MAPLVPAELLYTKIHSNIVESYNMKSLTVYEYDKDFEETFHETFHNVSVMGNVHAWFVQYMECLYQKLWIQ
jgi:phospholipid N-methyltransferase